MARQLYHHGLVDIWREMNPKARDYTHYSNPHDTFSRIDYLFLMQKHIPLVHGSAIRDSALSDHSLLLLTLNKGSIQHSGFNWRLNASIFSNPTHVSEIKRDIQEYLWTASLRPPCGQHIKQQSG